MASAGDESLAALDELRRGLWDAAKRVKDVAHRTPVMRSQTLDRRAGGKVFLKCENLQRMGAFKFRGAWNLVTRIPEDRRSRGVVAFSSGNHGQAVARVAQELRIPATIVMPSTASAPKLAAVRGCGAEVLFYDQLGEDRDALARRIAEERGATLVPPFDHPHILCGQGTAAIELFEETGPLEMIVAPVGGGGLLSGTALAASTLLFPCEVWGVEPEAGDDGRRSLASGMRETIPPPDTIADGARTQQLGVLTFEIVKRLATGIETVSDAEAIDAMRFAFERMKLVIEPTGALPLAALLSGKLDLAGATVGVILSGGNVDPARAAEWMSGVSAR